MSHIDIVRSALQRAEWDAQVLDGRDFNVNYWRDVRRQLTNIERELATVKRLSAALRACMDEREASA